VDGSEVPQQVSYAILACSNLSLDLFVAERRYGLAEAIDNKLPRIQRSAGKYFLGRHYSTPGVDNLMTT
jgi:hypothetical protein